MKPKLLLHCLPGHRTVLQLELSSYEVIQTDYYNVSHPSQIVAEIKATNPDILFCDFGAAGDVRSTRWIQLIRLELPNIPIVVYTVDRDFGSIAQDHHAAYFSILEQRPERAALEPKIAEAKNLVAQSDQS